LAVRGRRGVLDRVVISGPVPSASHGQGVVVGSSRTARAGVFVVGRLLALAVSLGEKQRVRGAGLHLLQPAAVVRREGRVAVGVTDYAGVIGVVRGVAGIDVYRHRLAGRASAVVDRNG